MESTKVKKIVLNQDEAGKIADQIVHLCLEKGGQNILNIYGGCLLAAMTLAFTTLSMGTEKGEDLEKNKQTFALMMEDVCKMIKAFDEPKSDEMREVLKEFFTLPPASDKVH